MRHELHLTAKGLRAAALLSLPLLGAGWLLADGRGAASVAAGVGLVVANHALAAASTGWARSIDAKAVSVGYGLFVVRMFAVFSVLAVLAGAGWAHRGLVAAGFCAALAVTLGAECVSYVRGSYVPSWRLGAGR